MLRDLVQHCTDVRLTDDGRLEVTGEGGRVTTVFLEGGLLQVARPGGVVDVLLAGVEDVAFRFQRMRSLQDTEPAEHRGTLWRAAPPDGASHAVILDAEQQLALGFTLRADAPESWDRVEEIDEELIGALLGSLTLRVGRIDGHGKEFCHLRREAPHQGAHTADRGLLTLELFEGRAPGDARPTGLALASLSLPMSELPEADYNWFDRSLGEAVLPPEVLDPGAVPDKSWWDRRPEVVLNVTPTLDQVELDLEAWRPVITPGKAYTLLLGTAGDDLLVVEAVEAESSVGSSVAMRSARGRGWENQSFSVWRSLEGVQSYSQTTEVLVPLSVETHLELRDGSSLDVAIGIEGRDLAIRPPVARRPQVRLEGDGHVQGIDRSLARLLDDTAGFPVTRYSGRTLLQGAELDGLVVLEPGSVLYLDDVVLRGSIVSDVVPGGGRAPRIVIDGALRISPSELLPGTAIYMPGGEVRTAKGVNPSLQIEGDLIARELQLDARGAIHGQVASVEEADLGASIEQPLVCRTRKLRAPGLDR